MGKHVPMFEIEASQFTAYSPERALLAAVLERAYRDLHMPVDRKTRRSAITWLLNTDSSPEEAFDGFTFRWITDVLELTQTQINHMIQSAWEAAKNDSEAREAGELMAIAPKEMFMVKRYRVYL